jgi:hypothetical protein
MGIGKRKIMRKRKKDKRYDIEDMRLRTGSVSFIPCSVFPIHYALSFIP